MNKMRSTPTGHLSRDGYFAHDIGRIGVRYNCLTHPVGTHATQWREANGACS